MRQSSDRSEPLTWLCRVAPIALFVTGLALAPACSCGDEKGPVVGANNGDRDTDTPDADVGGDAPDAADAPDAPGDVLPDVVPDAPDGSDVADVPDTADVPDQPLTQWADSCLFAVLNCLGGGLEPNSCTINQVTGTTAVSYGDRRASRWVPDVSGYVFDAFADGELCYEAVGGRPDEGPFWSITSAQQIPESFSARVAGETTTVTCADGSTEVIQTAQIGPYLPQILAPEDPLCVGFGAPRCDSPDDCNQFNPNLACCEVVDTARCLFAEQCPEIPGGGELGGCLAPLLECFGRQPVATACVIDPNLPETTIDYTEDRRAIITSDGDAFTVTTARGDDACYVAHMTGTRPWDAIEFEDPDTGETYSVQIDGRGAATVTCADDSIEVVTRDAILRFVPVFLDENEPLCDVLDLNECAVDGDCPGALCCPGADGNRCLTQIDACPGVEDPWEDSCLRPVVECFGDNLGLASCVQFGDLGVIQAEYAGGRSAVFFSENGRPATRTSAGGSVCFDALVTTTPQGYTIDDRVGGGVYGVEISGDDAVIRCADATTEVVPAARVLQYLPGRPSDASCGAALLPDECDGDNPCNGGICCDAQDRNICVADDEACRAARPHEVCVSDAACDEEETCCRLTDVRVCNPRVCPGGAVCCFEPQVAACGSRSECNIVDECALDDPESCPDGSSCCPSRAGNRCAEVDSCDDLDFAWLGSCLYDTFECFGTGNRLETCEYDEALGITDVTYAGGAREQIFPTLGNLGRRAGDQDRICYLAVDDGGVIGITDQFTRQRYSLTFQGDTARIVCPDDIEQLVPASSVRPYLQPPPAPEACERATPNHECDTTEDCTDLDPTLTCCDAGVRRQCLAADDCRRATPRPRCGVDAQCEQGLECCSIPQVTVCDPAVCGDDLCCQRPSDTVCAGEYDCRPLDECDPFAPRSCGVPGQTCCATDRGAECLDTLVCPDANDPVRASCIGTLLSCFGSPGQVDSCVDHDGTGVLDVDYTTGQSARYFTHFGLPGRLTTSPLDVPCYQALARRGGGWDLQDSINGDAYGISVVGPQATISCPGDVRSVVRSADLLPYFPSPPNPSVCTDAVRRDTCVNGADCNDPNQVCCDLGDLNACVTRQECEDATPRGGCTENLHCGQGDSCCDLPQVRVCDPALCGGRVCCDLGQTMACGAPDECGAVRDYCEIDAECGDGALCCQGNQGRRCVDGNVCPNQFDPSCIADTLGCFGLSPQLAQCLDEGDGTLDVTYDQNRSARFEGNRVNTFRDGAACYQWTQSGNVIQVLDGPTQALFRIAIEGNTAAITCPDSEQQLVPVQEIQRYFPVAPTPDQCLDPQDFFEDSCIYPLLVCAGTDLALDTCVDHTPVDRLDALYVGGYAATFGGRGDRAVISTTNPNYACYLAEQQDAVRWTLTDQLGDDVYGLRYEGDAAFVTCPDATVERVSRALVEPYLPARPDAGACTAAPRNDECQIADECGAGEVCCDTGRTNRCMDGADCFNSQPFDLCAAQADCDDADFCCARDQVRVCDVALCGDRVCCRVDASVCGDEAECAGVFNECDAPDLQDTCAQESLCCRTAEGNRCLVGEQCAPPPSVLVGSCIQDTLECFGAYNRVDACSDLEGTGRVEVGYVNGAHATYFRHFGAPARRTGYNFLRCFDAIEDPDGNLSVSDLNNDGAFGITFQGPTATITCPDETREQYRRSDIEAYFPDAPDTDQCELAPLDNQCNFDADCAQLGPGYTCCFAGDGNLCVPEDACERTGPHATCSEDADCAGDTACCELPHVRVCDPRLCGDVQQCCTLRSEMVCGSPEECADFFDVCNDDASCGDNSLCCETNRGRRCQDGAQVCPEVDDTWTSSCLFDVFECAGANPAFDSCLNIGIDGGAALVARYDGGLEHTFLTNPLVGARRDVRVGQTDCFSAFEVLEMGGGADVIDPQARRYEVRYEGRNARIVCPDNTIENHPRDVVGAYLPAQPAVEVCTDPAQVWAASCLFSTMACSGVPGDLTACTHDAQTDYTRAQFDNGVEGVFYTTMGRDAVRTSDLQQPCFRALASDAGFEVLDLATTLEYGVEIDGEVARIRCADDSLEIVRASDVLSYLPRPSPTSTPTRPGPRSRRASGSSAPPATRCGTAGTTCPTGTRPAGSARLPSRTSTTTGAWRS